MDDAMRVHGARGYGPIVSIIALLCGLWAPATHAQSWSWAYTESTANRIDAHPAAVSKPDARGFWAIGDSVLHFHPDGTLDFAHNQPRLGEGFAAASLSDGSLIYAHVDFTTGYYSAPCAIYRLGPDGSPRWGVEPWWQGPCRKVAVDGREVVWAQNTYSTLASFSADGVSLIGSNLALSSDFLQTVDFAVNRSAGNVFITTLDNSIVAYDDHGQLQWRWSDTNATAALDKIAVGSDGNVYVAGRADRSASGGALHIISLTPTGQQRFVVDAAGPTFTAIDAMSPLSSGGFYLVDRQLDGASSAEILTLQLIAADGSVLWARPQAGFIACTDYLPDCALTTTSENDALFAGLRDPSATWVVRYDGDGTLLHDVSLGNYTLLGSLASRDDGHALLTRVDHDYQSFLMELDRHGSSVAPPQTASALADNAGSAAYRPDGAYLANDGSSYLSVDDSAGHSTVKIDRDGNLAWQTPRIAERSYSTVSQGGDRVCKATFVLDPNWIQKLYCFATASGIEAWSATIDPAAPRPSPMRVLDDGSVLLLHQAQTGQTYFTEHLLLDSNGTELHRLGIADLGKSATNLGSDNIAANGTTTWITNDSRLVAYDRDAKKLYDVSVPEQMRPTDTFFYPTVKILADGSAVVTIYQDSGGAVTPFAWVVDPAGNTRWISAVDDPHGLGNSNYSFTVSASEGNADRLYFTLRSAVDTVEHSVTVVARLRSNGHLLWKSADVATDWDDSRLLANPTGAGLVLLSRQLEKLSIASIDPDTGAIRQRREQSCSDDIPFGGAAGFSNFGYSLFDAALTADDLLRVFVASVSNTGPTNDRLYALRYASSAPALVRLDQPGISGAWYPAYSGGQGFTLDYIASAHTLFMPWFTFAPQQDSLPQDTLPPLFGVTDPLGLAWYGLQGSVSAGARSADLAIAVTDTGTLNSGIVVGHAVGTAHLSLSDCNNATLYYQFDAGTNGGAGGLISLARLTPATSPCVLADGSITAAQNANAAAQGFDARQSGSWFDPATGGQGLEMTIIPADNGSNGVVFAAWFTFDPQGKSDDPIHQHWFTLQGDLASAADGKVTLPLYRIIGGALDGASTGNFAQVGHATLTMQGCDTAQLEYQFDPSEVAHAFAGLGGTSHLVKIGGCSAQ